MPFASQRILAFPTLPPLWKIKWDEAGSGFTIWAARGLPSPQVLSLPRRCVTQHFGCEESGRVEVLERYVPAAFLRPAVVWVTLCVRVIGHRVQARSRHSTPTSLPSTSPSLGAFVPRSFAGQRRSGNGFAKKQPVRNVLAWVNGVRWNGGKDTTHDLRENRENFNLLLDVHMCLFMSLRETNCE